MLFSDKKRPAILRIVERRGGCDVFTEESKFRLDKLPPAHRAALAVELGHHFVAGIHARGAADAFHLQAVADVDAGRADLHANAAIDTITQALRIVINFA